MEHLTQPLASQRCVRLIIMCYTGNMASNRQIWRVWANFLHRWGVRELAATFLEALGPLSILGAQLVFFGSPLLRPHVPASHLDALTHLLEDDDQTATFVAFLRDTDTLRSE